MTIEESVKYLAKEAKKREEYALAKGYTKCKRCGSLFLGKENLCSSCKNLLIQEVIEIFGRENTCHKCREFINQSVINKN